MPKKPIVIILKALCSVVVVGLICVLVYNPDPYANKPTSQLPSPALKTLADNRGIQIGNFASLKYLKEQAYRDITVSQFNYAIVDGEPNWRFETSTLRPTIDTFDFTDMDKVFDFAQQNHMPVRVQHLMWGDAKWLPDWLTQGKFSREQLLEIIHSHISTVASRYKGTVREYSVVNYSLVATMTGGEIT